MKILHLIYSLQVSGAEKYLLDLLPRLKQNGIDCGLIAVIPEADQHKFIEFRDQLNNKGVTTQIFTGSPSSFIPVARRIDHYLKENKIQYVHAHLFKADLLAVMIKKLFNKKLFILSTKHGYDERYFNRHHSNPGKIDHNVYYFISKFINANIDAQVTISKAMADLYYNLKLTKKKMPYIHHGIDLAIPNDTTGCRLAEQQLIIVGRIEEMKGHIYLFKAMPAVIKIFPHVKLLVLGNGSEKEKLMQFAKEAGIENNISFMGFQQRPAAYIAASDIVILPSLFEPFGLVYIEAFALKVPVIAFDTQACNELIRNDQTGILVKIFDVEGLSDKIIYLLHNPSERGRIAEAAYKSFTTHFNLDRMIAETVAWYRLVILN